eukprot:scaffold96878_cov45-Phaeocystis_antarctica.AAC.2
MKCKQHSFSRDPRACGVDLERLGEGGNLQRFRRAHDEPRTRRGTRTALSTRGGTYCGRRRARAAVEQASLGEEKLAKPLGPGAVHSSNSCACRLHWPVHRGSWSQIGALSGRGAGALRRDPSVNGVSRLLGERRDLGGHATPPRDPPRVQLTQITSST